MGTSKLTITHPEVSHASLDAYLSKRAPHRVKLRIAILQGVMEREPIDHLSRRRKMSRQGIYNLVYRINREGLHGLEDHHLGRPGKLTAKLADDLKETLTYSPMDQGYEQMRWDNPLVRRYLKERHGIEIGRAQLVNWLNLIGTPVKLARKKYERTHFKERDHLADSREDIRNRQRRRFIARAA
ncbi:MAG TPA: helix-turn-helix domain-containing protein [Syntrophales bacterium]|nr:helix-turn-helix domain-containing protein [Syntrophales bacterium]